MSKTSPSPLSKAEHEAQDTAQLRAVDREEEAAIARANATIGDAREKAATKRAAIETASKKRQAEVFAAFVARANAELPGVIGEWAIEPSRAITARVGAKLVSLLAIETRDLGLSEEARRWGSLTSTLCAEIFVDAAAKEVPEVIFMFAHTSGGLFNSHPVDNLLGDTWSHAARHVLHAVEQPAQLELALREVESLVCTVTTAARKQCSVLPDHLRDRWAAMRRRDDEAVKAVDAARAQVEAERTERERAHYKAQYDREHPELTPQGRFGATRLRFGL